MQCKDGSIFKSRSCRNVSTAGGSVDGSSAFVLCWFFMRGVLFWVMILPDESPEENPLSVSNFN